MAQMAQLPVAEAVRIDTQRLGDIIRELGDDAARGMIRMSMAQITAALAAIGPAAARGDMRQVAQLADRLSRVAWQIGMTTLSGVAVDAGDCAGRGDHAAVGAVVARLRRVGDGSLATIWDRTGDG